MSVNRFKEAFKEGGNLIYLALAVSLSAAIHNPVPVLVGVVGEVAYLMFVPDSRWFANRLAKRLGSADEVKKHQATDDAFARLQPDLQDRYRRLAQVRAQIGSEAGRKASWYSAMLAQLDSLLEKFVLFAFKEQECREYLWQTLLEARGASTGQTSNSYPNVAYRQQPGPGRTHSPISGAPPMQGSLDVASKQIQAAVTEIQKCYDAEIQSVNESLANQVDDEIKAVQLTRSALLQRRRDSTQRIGNLLRQLQYQLKAVEDAFGVVNDQIRLQPSEQVGPDIEDVVTKSDVLAQTLQEMAPIEQATLRAGGGV